MFCMLSYKQQVSRAINSLSEHTVICLTYFNQNHLYNYDWNKIVILSSFFARVVSFTNLSTNFLFIGSVILYLWEISS